MSPIAFSLGWARYTANAASCNGPTPTTTPISTSTTSASCAICPNVFLLDGEKGGAQSPQSSCAQIRDLDFNGEIDMVFDLRHGADYCDIAGVTGHSQKANPVLIRTSAAPGGDSGSNRLAVHRLECPAGSKWRVELNNDHNRVFYNDAWHVIDWRDDGRDNQFLQH